MTLKEYDNRRSEIFSDYRSLVDKIHREFAVQFITNVCLDPDAFDELVQRYDDALLKANAECQSRLADLSRSFLKF
jgi:hypothetical protein